ncbi:MAG: PIN domain-containing protein [Cyanobacteria bacterium J06614_10]
MKYVVDTHALLWFLLGSSRLGRNARAVFDNPSSELVLPATALAEATWIVSRGKVSTLSAVSVLKAINKDKRITIYPLDQSVVERTITLTNINEMHDRQIVATVMELCSQGKKAALLTCDQNITAANLIPVVW